MDLRQSKAYAQFLEGIGWKVEKVKGNFFFIKKLPIIGSAIKLQRTKSIPLKDIELLAKKHRAFQLIIEPDTNVDCKTLIANGYILNTFPYLSTKSLQLNINQTEKNIIDQMKKDGRYSLRKSENIEVREQVSLEDFRKDWKKIVKNKRHVLPIHELHAFKKAFGKNMIFLENKEGTAGGMFLLANKIAYYWIGFTSDTARHELTQYQIIWKGILWAKTRGAKIFDFEGIYDERFPIKGWQGFTHFKKSFGGKEVLYPGSFTKWRIPF